MCFLLGDLLKLSIGVLLLPVAVSVAAAQTVSFLYPTNAYVSGQSAGASMCSTCISIADFNGDGKPDIAISSGSTWIYPGNGDGTFGAPIAVAGCSSISAVADFNGDRKADLICGTTVLLGNGDGTFRNAEPVAPNSPGSTLPPTVVLLTADFNNDGKPDLLLGMNEETGMNIWVALGNGDGTFSSQQGAGMLLYGPFQAGDFNGDGNLDILGTSVTDFIVLPGNGNGTFCKPIKTNDSVTGNPTVVGDFNKDGKADLIVGDAVLAGNGDGTFQFPVFFGSVPQSCGAAYDPGSSVVSPCGSSHAATAVADFNGDGLLDLATGSVVQVTGSESESVVTVLLNDSPGDGFTAAGVSSANPVWFDFDSGSIVSAFGVNLAPMTEAATASPFPTTLGGIRLHVLDRSHATDTLAPLLYVSPTQINYVLPSSDAFAWIGIERVGSPFVQKGMSVPIITLGVGLYSVGNGLAAASAVRVAPDGTQTFVPVILCNAQSCTPVPIDLSGDPVYLSLYGTGFDQVSAAASSCQLAGQDLTPTYAGPQGQTEGLDQVNLLLPKTLAGSGAISFMCYLGTTSEEAFTNFVSVTIR